MGYINIGFSNNSNICLSIFIYAIICLFTTFIGLGMFLHTLYILLILMFINVKQMALLIPYPDEKCEAQKEQLICSHI